MAWQGNYEDATGAVFADAYTVVTTVSAQLDPSLPNPGFTANFATFVDKTAHDAGKQPLRTFTYYVEMASDQVSSFVTPILSLVDAAVVAGNAPLLAGLTEVP